MYEQRTNFANCPYYWFGWIVSFFTLKLQIANETIPIYTNLTNPNLLRDKKPKIGDRLFYKKIIVLWESQAGTR
jgi:hypothetical protein